MRSHQLRLGRGHRRCGAVGIVHPLRQLMEEVEDQNEVEREINDILAQGAGLDDIDVEALEAELLELVPQEEEKEAKEDEAKVPDMPVAPSDKLPDVKVPAEEEEAPAKSARVAVAS